MPEPDADRRDLVLKPGALVRPGHPNADAVFATLAAHIESGERSDNPLLKASDIGPHVGPAPPEVEHHIGDALARTVIGQLPAATARKNRKTGIEQVAGLAAGARGVERGVLEQPYQFWRAAGGDMGHPRLHRGDGLRIRDRRVGDQPLHRTCPRFRGQVRQIKGLAVINHWLTITW